MRGVINTRSRTGNSDICIETMEALLTGDKVLIYTGYKSLMYVFTQKELKRDRGDESS